MNILPEYVFYWNIKACKLNSLNNNKSQFDNLLGQDPGVNIISSTANPPFVACPSMII